RWTFIQKHFAKEIKNRVEGKTAQIIAQEIDEHKKALDQSKPGEIRKEYQEYLLREQERIRLEKENEEKQSLALIQKLIEEEERLSLNDYIDLINNTPVVARSGQVQPFRPLTNTNPLNRQINNLNSHLMHRVNSMEHSGTPIRAGAPSPAANSVARSSRGRPKRKHKNSASSANQSVDSQTQDEASRPATRSRHAADLPSETSTSSLLQSDLSSLNDTNEASSSVSEQTESVVRRRLRPRRAKV
ncbi:E3 ubiquitin-ligase RNF168-like, partial [Brachionus plicatilis]